MAVQFDHLVLRVPAGDLPRVRSELGNRSWVIAGGGLGIGWHSDEFAAIVAGAGPSPSFDGADVTERRQLVATARPDDATPPALDPGVLALRWFELDSSDWPEFLDLSTNAWPAFEQAYDARILGLFRSLDLPEPQAGALLVTWYPSLSAWERSRGTLRATEGGEAEAGRKFLRRREITKRSIVRVSPC